jgi:hypothetical protein
MRNVRHVKFPATYDAHHKGESKHKNASERECNKPKYQ